MESSEAPTRVLVVAHKTAATQPLLDAVRERAQRGPSRFTLLVPRATHGLHKVVDPEDQDAGETQSVIDQALPLRSDAAGTPVEALIGDADPVNSLTRCARAWIEISSREPTLWARTMPASAVNRDLAPSRRMAVLRRAAHAISPRFDEPIGPVIRRTVVGEQARRGLFRDQP